MATVTIVSSDGKEFNPPLAVANGALLIKEIVEQNPESTEPVPLPSVATKELALVLEYLQLNCTKGTPLKNITRPLRPTLQDSGVPDWAVTFINGVALQDIMDLIEAATFMRVKMLVFLGCARIAMAIKRIGIDKLKSLAADYPALTTAQERDLKAQNEWAWKEPERPVTDDSDSSPDTSSGAGDGADGTL